MSTALATTAELRQHAELLAVLAERRGLVDLAIGADPGELIAVVTPGRTYLDVSAFELDVIAAIDRDVRVTPAGAPGAQITERLTATPAA